MTIQSYLQELEIKRIDDVHVFLVPEVMEAGTSKLLQYWADIVAKLEGRQSTLPLMTTTSEAIPAVLQLFARIGEQLATPDRRMAKLAAKCREHIAYLREKIQEIGSAPLSEWPRGLALGQASGDMIAVIRNVVRETIEHLCNFAAAELGFPPLDLRVVQDRHSASTAHTSGESPSVPGGILVKTIQHTGTWFTVDFLRSHPDVDGFVEIDVLPAMMVGRGTGRDVFPAMSIGKRHTVFKSHFPAQMSGDVLLTIASLRTIVPLRDPLLSVMTRNHRHPEIVRNDLIDVWESSARVLSPIERDLPIYYAAVDLADSEAARRDLLSGVCRHAELACEPHARQWAARWPLDINSTGHYPMKDAYRQRDVKFLKRALGREWFKLKEIEQTVRPWLEAKGYKDLMWWD
jgi:hypothetical protein